MFVLLSKLVHVDLSWAAGAKQQCKLVSRLGGALEMRFLWSLGLRGWLSSLGPPLRLRCDRHFHFLVLFCFVWFLIFGDRVSLLELVL